MALTRSNWTIIFVLFALAIIGGLIYIYRDKIFGSSCDPLRNGFDKKGNQNLKCKFDDPNLTNTSPPSGSSGWMSDSAFPIKKGSWGPKVASLQRALGFAEGKCTTCADGKFGTITEDALNKKTGKKQVATQAEYDAIVSPKGVTSPNISGGNNFKELKNNLGSKAKDFQDGVSIDVSGRNKQFTFWFYNNGRFFITPIGKISSQGNTLKKGTYINGGTEMYVDDGNSYGNFISHPVTKNMASIIYDIE